MSNIRELTCIGCPMGCALKVKIENGKIIEVKGNTCLKGRIYAEKECTNPTRIVTSSIKVEDGEIATVSVKTESDIPKDRIFQCIEELKGLVVKAPIKIGDIILENVADTGVNIIATKEVNEI